MNAENATATIVMYSTAMTAIAIIVLFAVGVLPLWLAAVIIVADAAFAWFITRSMRSRT